MTSSKPPSDTQRLLRAFRVPPTAKKGSLIAGSGLVALGAFGATVAFLPAAAVAASLAIFEVTDRRAIRKGLRELEPWGLPIEGYRQWLLADEPAFDVELRRAVDTQVVATSSRAIDPGIDVRRIGDREVRFITRRVALPGVKPGETPTYLADRRLLFEIHERILAPLHADVGIARVRMGEKADLEARPSAPLAPADDDGAPAVAGMGAFRDQAMAAPPALQALVHTGSTLALARDARSVRNRHERVVHATGRTPHGVGAVLGISLGIASMGAGAGPIGLGVGWVVGLITGTAIVVGNNRRNAMRAETLLSNAFPIEDYDAWLVSGRPLFDVVFAGEVDQAWFAERLRSITAFSDEASASVVWVEDIKWLDAHIVRVETRPALISPTGGRVRAFYGGSHVLMKYMIEDVLNPVHREVGIEVVRMGGYVNRRV